MSEYKWQHFLPAVYLKNFSEDPEPGRKSFIWRFDGKTMNKITVETQCAANYFYTKENPKETEQQFGISEALYDKCVKIIQANSPVHPNDYFGFILILFDLHIRNDIYHNQTGHDGLGAYSMRVRMLERGLLLGRPLDEEVTAAQVHAHLDKYWRVCVLSPGPGRGFFTSDNPSLLFALTGTGPQIEMAMLPVTPLHLAVAFDTRVVSVRGNTTTNQDEVLINGLQMSHCFRCVYANRDFDGAELALLTDWFKDRRRERPVIDQTGWNARIIRLDQLPQLSFLRFSPPLM